MDVLPIHMAVAQPCLASLFYRLVFCILNIVLRISRTASSVESVLVSLGMICIVTGMARGVNHSAPITVVEADCFSSSCQQEFLWGGVGFF